MDAISNMRESAAMEKDADMGQLTESHAWYMDMMDKLIIGSKKTQLSETEVLIYEFIRG